MNRMIALAACLAVATPAVSAPSKKPPAAQPDKKEEAAKKADDFDMAKVMAMFENIFPAGPEPAPARLALAKTTAAGMLPNGTYAALFDDAMSGVVERVLSIKPGDLGVKADKSATTLREEMIKEDPYFEERMNIMRKVIGEELIKISAVMEPKLRDGLARSIARRFDEKQLGEINAFIATDSGRAFAAQTMRMWVDPDVLRSMMQTMPHMISAMPAAMMRLEAETAHLPKPKKKEAKKQETEEEEVDSTT